MLPGPSRLTEGERNMKKLISVLCLLAMLASLAACGAPAAETTAPTASPATEAVTEAPTETTEAPTEAPVPVRLGAMTGPTGIGMVKLFDDADRNAGSPYTYTIKGAADELTPMLLQGELDIVSVPANLASVLYNKTEGKVQALAVNVLGVLYLAEFNSDEVNTVAGLKGKTVYATGKGSTPEYFLRYILTRNGLDPDKDLTIEWKSEPSEVAALLNGQGRGIAMLPQPYVTAAASQLGEGFRVKLSVSDEWAKVSGGVPCTTACILVRSQFAQEHPQAVEQFLADFAQSAAWVNENVDAAGDLCGQYEIVKAPIAKKAIPQCNIVSITGSDMKTAVSGCLGVLFDQNPQAVGGQLPGDDFYYGA